ncbi:SUMF1/EgtB/PvdO family nonheme iron enzyme [Oscillochloris sp. ZM17-4]|uniref:NACHT domain-containing protein n=1 Tax=Oscillochloris sp. ZM17-4 TaxID=2866714 RepID=UPI001C72E7D9|nr:SUMF1/EgtB/PvdO family nonheme iron enzyme [Oscillochloris sp. ZM17-4]MBX0330065.1 SUMF1/EgtB/PvdO family nonheme iron enzyme [Oscillochloris sp. ZM17-4]
MSDDLAAQLRSLLSLRQMMGEPAFAQTLARLRDLHGEARVDALLAQVSSPAPGPGGVSVSIQTDSGSISGAPVSVVGHADNVTFPPPADPAEARRAAALIAYLRRTMADCNALPLVQIDRTDPTHTRPLQLARLYISLNTTQQIELTDAEADARPSRQGRVRLQLDEPLQDLDRRPTRPLGAVEVLNDESCAMLLGVPGGGKSTFVSHLSLCLAGAALGERGLADLQPEGGWLSCLPRWGLGPLLPVRVILRDLAAFAPLAAAPKGSLRLLELFLAATLKDAGCAEALEPLTAALRAGNALLLLDGLDEVVGSPVLQRVVETISDARRGYVARTLVTCRVLDYQEEPLRQIAGFPTVTLAELDEPQILRFVGDWYAELEASGRRPAAQTEADTRALREAVSGRPELRALAGTPLLLTVMALVHAFRGTLPDARALLYAECIDLLLLRWRQPRGESDLLERLGLPQFRSSDLLALMARLGYEAHLRAERDTEQTGSADLDEPAVMAILAEGFARYDAPRKFQLAEIVLGALTRGNGLLLKRGPEVYTFAHRTFQEFLAGFHLKGQRDYRKLCLERTPLAHWHEVLTLMVGYQVLQDRELEKPLSLAEQLLGRSPLEQALAGELLVLIGQERAEQYDPALLKLPDGLWPRARTTLLRLLTRGRAPEAPATLRNRAGLALGLLCYGPLESLDRPAAQVPMPDPRLPFAVIGLGAQRSKGWPQALAHYWCPVEPGPFWSGDDRPPEEEDDESVVKRAVSAVGRALRGQGERKTREPLRRVRIDGPYQIARYPVTNADFARFIAADGYAQQCYWTENGWRWLQGQGKNAGGPASYRPPNWGRLGYHNPLQPVVTVTWYEAAAYCRWLTVDGHQAGWLPRDQEIRLPTWHEWERAARHTDQRPHPWGQEPPDPERANYKDTGIGVPSPIGGFALGAAVCGAQDMLGNVMEWTATPDAQPGQGLLEKDFTQNTDVVISYSGWTDEVEYLCCGARYRFYPGNGYGVGSFRVVQSLRAHE